MFQQEINGYNRTEVDAYIQKLKANYESKLMTEKLKALDSEKKLLDAKNERVELENKEKNILNAINVIEKQQQFQEEGSKKIYGLVMNKLELLLHEVDIKFPQLKRDKDFADLYGEFSNLVRSSKTNLERNPALTQPIGSGNDSMRTLLAKMQEYKKVKEAPKEVKIQTIKPKPQPKEEERFSFEEALHPTEDLEEIMKAFDFYNEA
jgi:hypothetical protein